MLVERTYKSHADAWTDLDAPDAKSAHRDKFGDIYEPSDPPGLDRWSEKSYKKSYEDSITCHVHGEAARIKDIEKTFYGHHPYLLVGDPRLSYLWSKPLIRLKENFDKELRSAHFHFYEHLEEFLNNCDGE
jgi:hypothetical protein